MVWFFSGPCGEILPLFDQFLAVSAQATEKELVGRSGLLVKYEPLWEVERWKISNRACVSHRWLLTWESPDSWLQRGWAPMMYISGIWIGVSASDLRDRSHIYSQFKLINWIYQAQREVAETQLPWCTAPCQERRPVPHRTKFRRSFYYFNRLNLYKETQFVNISAAALLTFFLVFFTKHVLSSNILFISVSKPSTLLHLPVKPLWWHHLGSRDVIFGLVLDGWVQLWTILYSLIPFKVTVYSVLIKLEGTPLTHALSPLKYHRVN